MSFARNGLTPGKRARRTESSVANETESHPGDLREELPLPPPPKAGDRLLE